MTREGRVHLIAVALILSLGAHVAGMYFARPKVMTHVAAGAARAAKRPPMRVTRGAPAPEPVRIDAVADVKPLKDAPAAALVEEKPIAPPTEAVESAVRPAPPAVAPAPVEPDLSIPTFEARPPEIADSHAEHPLPMGKIALPDAAPLGAAPAARRVSERLGETTPGMSAAQLAAAIPALGRDAESLFLPARMRPDGGAESAEPETAEGDKTRNDAREKAKKEKKKAAREKAKKAFTPAEEVYEKVEEKVVEEEKKAVRTLLNSAADEPNDLTKNVSVVLSAATKGDWTYFKAMVLPRRTLEVVPKDVVVLLDGSGSIGNDRLGSCRKAARRILRSCTNSGDRFNLVVFRNRYSYAFRTWRPCDRASFALADKWLANETAHGRTDVFDTIASVLTLPRDPTRPLIALVVTDGDANEGVSDTAEILSKFTALNDGLISVYMYGVKSSANRELIDALTHGNRGESFIFEGWRWSAGDGIEPLSERFRDPVLSDLRIIFAAACKAESHPARLKNLYRGETLEIYGRVPAGTREVAFSLKGLNGAEPYEGYFKFPLATASQDKGVIGAFLAERALDERTAR